MSEEIPPPTKAEMAQLFCYSCKQPQVVESNVDDDNKI
jgi:hypothetical protein